MTTLFLLSHQDDEVGVLHSIDRLLRREERAICVYLTNGVWAGVASATRNAESLKVLSCLGVPRSDIHFLGESLGIDDGRLVEHLDRALDGLIELANGVGGIEQIVTHAWEGGHQDHDAAHLLGRALAGRLAIAKESRQFALYRAADIGDGLSYGALRAEHGPIESHSFPLATGWRYFSLLRHFRSQARVMLKLGPYIARSYLIERAQRLQHLPPVEVVLQRPAQKLLYERWRLYDYSRFQQHVSPFITRHISSGSDGNCCKQRAS